MTAEELKKLKKGDIVLYNHRDTSYFTNKRYYQIGGLWWFRLVRLIKLTESSVLESLQNNLLAVEKDDTGTSNAWQHKYFDYIEEQKIVQVLYGENK